MSVLVTGATGKVGRQMVASLAAADLAVRAGSRNPGASSAGVTPVTFDWYDKETWSAALGDADGLIIKGLDVDDNAYKIVADLLASAPMVRHAVLLSAPGVDRQPDDQPRRALELVVQNAGKHCTILRANWFMQNFDEDERVFAKALRERNELHAPTGQVRVSFVDTRDVADATAAIITGSGLDAGSYTITGPDSVTFGEVADTIGEAIGRPVRHIDATPEEHREHLAAGPDRPAAYVAHISHLFEIVRTGVQAPVSDDFQQLTGAPPRTLDDYIVETWAP